MKPYYDEDGIIEAMARAAYETDSTVPWEDAAPAIQGLHLRWARAALLRRGAYGISDDPRLREALDHVGYMVDVFDRTNNIELIPMVRTLKRVAQRYLDHVEATWPRPWNDIR